MKGGGGRRGRGGVTEAESILSSSAKSSSLSMLARLPGGAALARPPHPASVAHKTPEPVWCERQPFLFYMGRQTQCRAALGTRAAPFRLRRTPRVRCKVQAGRGDGCGAGDRGGEKGGERYKEKNEKICLNDSSLTFDRRTKPDSGRIFPDVRLGTNRQQK